MAEAAIPTSAVITISTRAQALDRLRRTDAIFHVLTGAAAMTLLAILGGVIVSLFIGSLPVIICLR